MSGLPDGVWARRLALLALGIMLLAMPRLIPGNYWIRVFVQAGLAVMMALGLNVIAGYAGLVNLGYAAFYAVGAYTYAILASPQHGIHLPFLLLFPLAGALAGLVGYLLAMPGLRLKGDYLCIVTLSFGEIIRLFLNNLVPLTNGPAGIIQIDRPNMVLVTLTTIRHYYYFILFVCAIEVFLMNRLERSPIGRALTAIREDEGAARAMGLDTTRLKLLACATGAIPGGLAGALFAGLQTFVSPVKFGLVQSIAILTMLVIGGIGNVPGVVMGAVLLTILPEQLRTYTESYSMLIYGALLMIFALFRPQGIWPKRYRALPRTEEPESLAADKSTKVPDQR